MSRRTVSVPHTPGLLQRAREEWRRGSARVCSRRAGGPRRPDTPRPTRPRPIRPRKLKEDVSMRFRIPRRRGAALVEFAVIGPVFLFLVIALIVGGIGIFRYQEVASLAREGARYASVRGEKYQKVTTNPAATPQDVYNDVIVPGAVALDPTQLSYNVSWSPDKKQGSQVTVKVTYQWIPEAFLGGITLSSTSTMTITY